MGSGNSSSTTYRCLHVASCTSSVLHTAVGQHGGCSSSFVRSSFIVSGLLPQAYWWLRDKTPEDARVMAWWDYGYQITGIANRTSVADGNTWNHEHIATLGRILTAPQEEAHSYARHLADYLLTIN